MADEKVSVVNPDGTFTANWKESLPEDIRGEECLNVVTDFPGAIKQLVHAQKAIGKNKVVIPGDKSSPEELDAFYTAAGRPKTADDYKVEVPEDLADLFGGERLAKTKKLAHSLGISQKQFEAFMKADMESAMELLKQTEAEDSQRKADAEMALKKKFGAAFEERLHMANRLVSEVLTDGEKRMAFLEKYGNDPDIIEFISVVGSRLVESKALVAELTHNTPQEALNQIKALESTPGYYDGKTQLTPEQRNEITRKLRDLYKVAYPEARDKPRLSA